MPKSPTASAALDHTATSDNDTKSGADSVNMPNTPNSSREKDESTRERSDGSIADDWGDQVNENDSDAGEWSDQANENGWDDDDEQHEDIDDLIEMINTYTQDVAKVIDEQKEPTFGHHTITSGRDFALAKLRDIPTTHPSRQTLSTAVNTLSDHIRKWDNIKLQVKKDKLDRKFAQIKPLLKRAEYDAERHEYDLAKALLVRARHLYDSLSVSHPDQKERLAKIKEDIDFNEDEINKECKSYRGSKSFEKSVPFDYRCLQLPPVSDRFFSDNAGFNALVPECLQQTAKYLCLLDFDRSLIKKHKYQILEALTVNTPIRKRQLEVKLEVDNDFQKKNLFHDLIRQRLKDGDCLITKENLEHLQKLCRDKQNRIFIVTFNRASIVEVVLSASILQKNNGDQKKAQDDFNELLKQLVIIDVSKLYRYNQDGNKSALAKKHFAEELMHRLSIAPENVFSFDDSAFHNAGYAHILPSKNVIEVTAEDHQGTKGSLQCLVEALASHKNRQNKALEEKATPPALVHLYSSALSSTDTKAELAPDVENTPPTTPPKIRTKKTNTI